MIKLLGSSFLHITALRVDVSSQSCSAQACTLPQAKEKERTNVSRSGDSVLISVKHMYVIGTSRCSLLKIENLITHGSA